MTEDKTPQISIIMPCYNVAGYLSAAAESVLRQSFSELELLLVDDGSTDDTAGVCQDLADHDSRVRLIRQKEGHKGVASARNAGLDHAAGNYLFFLDPDDLLLSDRCLEEMHTIIEWSKVQMVMCGITTFISEEEVRSRSIKPGSILIYNGRYLCTKLLGCHIWSMGPCVAKLYRRELFDNFRFPEGKIFEDQWAAHHITYQCDRVVAVTALYYGYRQRADSIMHSSSNVLCYSSVISAMNDRLAFFRQRGGADLRKAGRFDYQSMVLSYYKRVRFSDEWKQVPLKERLAFFRALWYLYRESGFNEVRSYLTRLRSKHVGIPSGK